MNELDILDRLIKAAEKGGALSAAGVLFLGNVIQSFYIFWTSKAHNRAEKDRNSITEKSVEARLAMAQALEKVAERTEENSDRIGRIETILDERLARRA